MSDIIKRSECTGCGACVAACPNKCISMKIDDEGFWYPHINGFNCVTCEKCKKVCPIINEKNRSESIKGVFAAYHKDEQIRYLSSSGGVFSAISEVIYQMDGAVVGASFDDDFNVRHIITNDLFDLKRIMGAKYIQSRLDTVFDNILKMLDAGTTVLFSGTPCQVEGLLSFLPREYENLYTVDLICHGVASPMVLEKYINEIGTPKSIAFRDKSTGWINYSFKAITSNKVICEKHRKNSMMICYLSNICLRESCYQCKYKALNRTSDITLGDFWGIEKIDSEFNDNKGTSLIIVHSFKGERLLSAIEDKVIIKDEKIEAVIENNSSIIKSAPKPANRKEFMSAINSNKPFSKVVNKYCKEKLINKIIRKISRMFIVYTI